MLRAMLANTARRVERAGGDGRLDPTWAERLRLAIGSALSVCDRARQAGAVLPVRLPVPGADVEVTDAAPQPRLEPDPHGWLGRR